MIRELPHLIEDEGGDREQVEQRVLPGAAAAHAAALLGNRHRHGDPLAGGKPVGLTTIAVAVGEEVEHLPDEFVDPEKIDELFVLIDELGIEMVDVRMKRVDYPDQTSQAIYARMKSERDREAREFRGEFVPAPWPGFRLDAEAAVAAASRL